MGNRVKAPKIPRKDQAVLVRFSREQYEKLARAAEASAVPVAVFCRTIVVQGLKDFRLRGISSSRRAAVAKGVAA